MKTGLDISTTIKTLFFLSFAASGFTMYFFVNSLLKNKLSALLSTILYLWLPYHFLIIFVSASMGIAFVFTFLPLVLLGIHLLKEEKRIGIVILAIGLSGIILSHIMHLIFLSPLIFIFLFWEFISSLKKAIFLKNITLGLILTALLSSFYLIPALSYNGATRIHEESGFYELYKRNFINLNQLIYSKWSFSPIVNNAKNGEVSFQLGIAQWITILMLILLIFLKKINKVYRTLSFFLLLSFIINIFLMLDFSKSIWSIFAKFIAVDFPFRFLLPATFTASLVAGLLLLNIKRKLRFFLFLFLTIIALYSNRNHINVNQYTDFPITTYLDLETERTTNTFNEYLPIKADSNLLGKPWNEIRGSHLSVSNTRHATNLFSFNVSTIQEQSVSIGQFYFPGQTLYVNNRPTLSNIDREGRINFTLPQGEHNITVKYQPTLLIKISKYLTATGLLVISLLILKERKII